MGKKFSAGTPVSDIKYNYMGFKNQDSFYLFSNQFDYALAHYFAELETTKSNINKFLSYPLIIPLTKKLSYKNVDEWIEKVSKIS